MKTILFKPNSLNFNEENSTSTIRVNNIQKTHQIYTWKFTPNKQFYFHHTQTMCTHWTLTVISCQNIKTIFILYEFFLFVSQSIKLIIYFFPYKCFRSSHTMYLSFVYLCVFYIYSNNNQDENNNKKIEIIICKISIK